MSEWIGNDFEHSYCVVMFTCGDCEQVCGTSQACSEGVAGGWAGAPKDEWERRDWRGGWCLGPTWTAGTDVGVWGSGCPPSEHRTRNAQWSENTLQSFNDIGESSQRRIPCVNFAGGSSISALVAVTGGLPPCRGPHCTCSLGGSGALPLQATERTDGGVRHEPSQDKHSPIKTSIDQKT